MRVLAVTFALAALSMVPAHAEIVPACDSPKQACGDHPSQQSSPPQNSLSLPLELFAPHPQGPSPDSQPAANALTPPEAQPNGGPPIVR